MSFLHTKWNIFTKDCFSIGKQTAHQKNFIDQLSCSMKEIHLLWHVGYLLFGEKKVQVKSSIGDVIMSKDTTLSFIFDQLNLVLQIGPFLNSEQGQIPLSLREKSNQNNGGMSGHSSLCQIHNLDGIYLIENIISRPWIRSRIWIY